MRVGVAAAVRVPFRHAVLLLLRLRQHVVVLLELRRRQRQRHRQRRAPRLPERVGEEVEDLHGGAAPQQVGEPFRAAGADGVVREVKDLEHRHLHRVKHGVLPARAAVAGRAEEGVADGDGAVAGEVVGVHVHVAHVGDEVGLAQRVEHAADDLVAEPFSPEAHVDALVLLLLAFLGLGLPRVRRPRDVDRQAFLVHGHEERQGGPQSGAGFVVDPAGALAFVQREAEDVFEAVGGDGQRGAHAAGDHLHEGHIDK